MTRKRPPAEAPVPLPPVHVIDPHAVYLVDQLRQFLRLKVSTVRHEVREGRLRVSKRAGRYYVLGAWVLSWIEAGEVRPRPRPARAADRNSA